MRIDRQTVVAVTGASRGIGRGAAIAFARRGARLVLLSRDEARMAEVAERVREAGGDAMAIACDVSDEAQCHAWVPKALERFGKIDVLVNNAAYGHRARIDELSTEDWERIFRTNFYGSFWCAKAVLPHMKARKTGHIVNVSTIISRRTIPLMGAYCATKFALNSLDEALRIELRPDGVGVSLVCPGVTDTDFSANSRRSGVDSPWNHASGMSAGAVGEAIARAVERKRRRVYLTASGRFLLFLNWLSPALVDEILYRFVFRKLSARR